MQNHVLQAASVGSANMIDLLLQGERGRRLVLHKGRFGVIALHQASGYGHSSVVSMLLQVGEGMDHIMVQDEKGMTALHHACFGGSQATVEVRACRMAHIQMLCCLVHSD